MYPAPSADWDAVFPDGTPIKKDKRPSYVFVWKTWGESVSAPPGSRRFAYQQPTCCRWMGL